MSQSGSIKGSGGGSASGTIFTAFTASGTWTKNSKTKWIEIIAWGGGSGGASGAKYAYVNDISSPTGGGAGTGSGSMYYYGPASVFGPTETITIGAGGDGGDSVTVSDTPGNNGNIGEETSIGNLSTFTFNSESNGIAGDSSTPGEGGVPGKNYTPNLLANMTAFGGNGGFGAIGPATSGFNYGATSLNGPAFTGGGGGGGGGIDYTTGIGENGQNGGSLISNLSTSPIILAGGIGGTYTGSVDGLAGGNGSTVTSGGMFASGTGGGGGASSVTGNGGNGGNGGIPGGGGGGGGAALDDIGNSGAGGNGSRGELWIIEYT
jgi:hypothetical protein